MAAGGQEQKYVSRSHQLNYQYGPRGGRTRLKKICCQLGTAGQRDGDWTLATDDGRRTAAISTSQDSVGA